LLFGRWFGKAKLAPSISPGKTLVGAVAGIGSSIVTVFFLFELPQILKFLGLTPLKNHILPSTLTTVSTLHLVFVGIVLGVLCILGDLVESLMKRAAHVKDSGQVFPGHGGCLDRMDSFLFVSPFLYFWARMIGL
jgi:phosphatidate cytidylyltransferase